MYKNVDFPKTHDLVLLFNLLPKNEPLNLRIQDLQPLNRYSVEARYPGEWEPINEFEARDALVMVRVVRDVFRRMLRSVL